VALEGARRRTCFGAWEVAWVQATSTPGAETGWALSRATERLTRCLSAVGQVTPSRTPSPTSEGAWCALARGGSFVAATGPDAATAREAAWLEHLRWGLLAARAGVEAPSLAVLPEASWELASARCGPAPTTPSSWKARSAAVTEACAVTGPVALVEGPRSCEDLAFARGLATLPADASAALAARSQGRALSCLAYCQVDHWSFPTAQPQDLAPIVSQRDLLALLRATAGGAAAQGAGFVAANDPDTYWTSLSAAVTQGTAPGAWLSLPDGPVWQLQTP
jgi:hypothetical protein